MFGLNESTQFYVCQRYVRMNMGINGLYQIVRTEMQNAVQDTIGHHERNLPKKHEI